MFLSNSTRKSQRELQKPGQLRQQYHSRKSSFFSGDSRSHPSPSLLLLVVGGEEVALDLLLVLELVDGDGQLLVEQLLGLLRPDVDEQLL